MIKNKLKCFVQLVYFILFFVFSISSLDSFISGDVVYIISHDKENKKVPFPSITLCPSLETNKLVNLKINDIKEDYNLSHSQVNAFFVFETLKKLSLPFVLKNYSFNHKIFNKEFASNGKEDIRMDQNAIK